MRLSNKSTFSLAICLILLFALATVPAMANTISAEWGADVDAAEADAQPGWTVTLTYATAPGTTAAPIGNNITVSNAAVDGFAPTSTTTPAVTATTTVFTFRVELTSGSELADVDITTTDSATPAFLSRRVTLKNGRDLASTSLYRPKLKSITAPKSAQAVFEATVTFEAPAAAVTGASPVPAIGPSTGLRVADITSTDGGSRVISVMPAGANAYTVRVILGTADTTVSLATAFPHQLSSVATDLADDTATVVYDVLPPAIGMITLKSLGNRDLDPTSVSEAFDVIVETVTDTPPAAETFDLTVEFSTSPDARGADISNVGKVDGKHAATITPKANTTATDWPATVLTITVTATDLAGNSTVRSTEVTLAARVSTDTDDDTDDDTRPPTVGITSSAGTEDDAGKVIFTFTFNEALTPTGDNAFTVDDIDVSNSADLTDADLTTTNNMVFMLKVTPTNEDFPVKVSLKATAEIADTAGNLMLAASLTATGTYTPPGVLGVEIDAPAALELGVLTFTFTFAEAPAGPIAADPSAVPPVEGDPDPPGAFTVSDIRVSNAQPLVAANLVKQLQGADATEVVYELDVTPMDATMPVTVQLKARSVSNGKVGTALLIAGEISATFTPTVTDDDMVVDDGIIDIPANSFVVVVRNADSSRAGASGLVFSSSVMTEIWSEMPDLRMLFSRSSPGGGGALILTQTGVDATHPAVASGTVGISEVMWAIDASYTGNEAAQQASQWIELHNLNTTPVKVMLSHKTGLAITSDANITGNLVAPYLDVVTNFFDDRPGSPAWDVPGSNGSSTGGVDFVSMARRAKRKHEFSLTRRHEDKSDKARDGLYTRWGDGGANGANQSLDGRDDSSWVVSTNVYRRPVVAQNVPSYNYLGTPGERNSFAPETQPHIRASRRDVPASPFVFNEIANRAEINKNYEWIELRNVTADNQNLRNYLISIVTSNSSDAVFYQFPNANFVVPGGGVLLLVASDPRGDRNHPLAVGWNVDLNPENQVSGLTEIGINASSKHGRYKVADTAAAGMFGGLRSGLPDDGKFVLILRSPDNHEGHRSGADGGKGVAETGNNDLNRVVDIAGWDDDLSKNEYPNAVSNTSLWPLHAMGGTFSHNKLDSEKVHARRHLITPNGRAGAGAHENKNESGKTAYARGVGYTGIGYKRQAADSGVHGGDPGYHGITRNSAHANDGGPRVYISEIMLSQGTGRTSGLPQWIELYNASNYAVNLAGGDGVGWRLVIENPDDPIRTINFRSKGNVKLINPKQTVLVVSASARSIGSDVLPSGTVFPDTRVFNVYKELKGDFEMANRASMIVNPKAFNIRLIDGGKKVNDVVTYTTSDEIGNLDGNPRTSDQGMWEYPESITADNYRSSLIRIFDDGAPREGLSIMESNVKPLGGTMGEGVDGMDGIDMKYSWVHAVDTDFIDIFVRHTWYGNENDFGTPANRAAQILPVSLSFFRPTLQDGKVTIRWTTESELDNAGFNILRSEERNGEYKQVNTELIQGAGTTGERTTYEWVDATAKPGVEYYYQIEDVSFAGEHQVLAVNKLKGLISAKNKLTTTWSELKQASQ